MARMGMYCFRSFPAVIFVFLHATYFMVELYPIIIEIIDPHGPAKDVKLNSKYYKFQTNRPWYFIAMFYLVSLLLIVAYIQLITAQIHSSNHPKPGENVDGLHVCKTCNVIKEWDIVHCSQCNVCVAGYDHHCPMFNTCICVSNVKYFL